MIVSQGNGCVYLFKVSDVKMYNILVGLLCLSVCREGILDVILYHNCLSAATHRIIAITKLMSIRCKWSCQIKFLKHTENSCQISILSVHSWCVYSHNLQKQNLLSTFQQRHDGCYLCTTQRYSCTDYTRWSRHPG